MSRYRTWFTDPWYWVAFYVLNGLLGYTLGLFYPMRASPWWLIVVVTVCLFGSVVIHFVLNWLWARRA